MTLQENDFHWDSDFESVRAFLGEIYRIQTSYTNWIPSEFENVKYGPGGTEYLREEDEYLKMWRIGGKIIAVSYTQPSGSCNLSIHPKHTSEIKPIVQWMEKRVRELAADDVKMSLAVDDEDSRFISYLAESGFQQDELDGDIQIRPVDLPAPSYNIPEGYSIRNAIMEEDFDLYREVQKAVFPHIKTMSNPQLELYSEASFYKPDLDIVAVGADANFAAFCTGRLDPVSRIAELEPVGTHPDHRKLGLAHAVICECLKRLETNKPSDVVIIGAAPTEGARRLYKSVGFVKQGTRHYWTKML
jgi:ribosomal protein S18 acetylase RimI-like enzyme